MAINPKIYASPEGYKRSLLPILPDALEPYLDGEFERLERAIQELVELAPQATDSPPQNPRVGMIRAAVEPWDPLGDGTVWVWWDGNSWQAL